MIDLLIIPAVATAVYYLGNKILNWKESSLRKRHIESFAAPTYSHTYREPISLKGLRATQDLASSPVSPTFRRK